MQKAGTSEHVERPQNSQQRDRCAGYAQREARPRVLNALARCFALSLIGIELLRGSLFRRMPPRQSGAAG